MHGSSPLHQEVSTPGQSPLNPAPSYPGCIGESPGALINPGQVLFQCVTGLTHLYLGHLQEQCHTTWLHRGQDKVAVRRQMFQCWLGWSRALMSVPMGPEDPVSRPQRTRLHAQGLAGIHSSTADWPIGMQKLVGQDADVCCGQCTCFPRLIPPSTSIA